MKKKIFVGALVLIIGIGSLVGYAEEVQTPNILPGYRNPAFSLEEREAWFKERTEYRKNQLKKALESGLITEEEAKVWEEHFAYMDEFHAKNDFLPGGCGGFGRGMGMMRGGGFRGGMMRGATWNR